MTDNPDATPEPTGLALVTSKCRCKARIAKVKLLATGQAVYVDAAPSSEGSVTIISKGLAGDKKSPPTGALASIARRRQGGDFHKIHKCEFKK